ncbi:Uncharacterised protein [Mycobacteroides abscessus subsp. abscessus]|uniref:hypothetical protein n=1 Tax=Mycobacteroides abscessus TaxID=36809 RepID=UPI0009278127|nr:hypothetical protein [Mycobacteroides abscessus]SIH35468.1 Uncharacterised protein [Mycobacteroides abscessus subsp. abscessus]
MGIVHDVHERQQLIECGAGLRRVRQILASIAGEDCVLSCDRDAIGVAGEFALWIETMVACAIGESYVAASPLGALVTRPVREPQRPEMPAVLVGVVPGIVEVREALQVLVKLVESGSSDRVIAVCARLQQLQNWAER